VIARVYIERLILDGIDVPPAQRPMLQARVQTELSRLLARGRISPDVAADRAVPSRLAGSFQYAGDHDPVRLGGQIARSLYSRIGQ